MKFSFSIENWYGLSSGLSTKTDWLQWSSCLNHDWTLPLPKLTKIPMMQARRMSIPSRLAVEVGLELIDDTNIDFIIFISRHGELERTYKILSSFNQNSDISPTDFALSVHNTASGLLTIIANKSIPITSIAAGVDGFQQGLLEALSLLKQDNKKVLLIDFDGAIPDAYQSQINTLVPVYAIGFILTLGNDIEVESIPKDFMLEKNIYPQALAFLHPYLNKQKNFLLQGNFQNWQWTINN